jgi:hypothetical protein
MLVHAMHDLVMGQEIRGFAQHVQYVVAHRSYSVPPSPRLQRLEFLDAFICD